MPAHLVKARIFTVTFRFQNGPVTSLVHLHPVTHSIQATPTTVQGFLYSAVYSDFSTWVLAILSAWKTLPQK